MMKPNFSDIVNKVKSGTGEIAEKAKVGVADAIVKVAETAENNAKEKEAKKLKKEEEKAKSAKEGKDRTEEKEKEPRVKLDDELRMSVDQYNDAYTRMNDAGTTLYRERTRAVDLILHIENLINSIANRPKEFDTEIAEIQTQRKNFTEVSEFAKQELEAAKKSALGAGAGVAAGAAVVSVAPAAAMWVATTFGTASTGTAISTLSGAAATNAALAWLGGGALTTGGGGIIGGKALLALSGTVGWSIAGATLLASVVLFSAKKVKLDKKKKEEIEAVKNNTLTVKKVAVQVQTLLDEVVELRDRLNEQYNGSLEDYGKDFLEIPRERQMQLGVLVNNTKALAASLGKRLQ